MKNRSVVESALRIAGWCLLAAVLPGVLVVLPLMRTVSGVSGNNVVFPLADSALVLLSWMGAVAVLTFIGALLVLLAIRAVRT